MMRPSFPVPSTQAGVSLIELLVGVAVGLVVVLGAVLLMTNALGGNRRLLLETRVNQDLRTAADLVARDVRRAGFWRNAASGVFSASGTAVTANPYTEISLNSGVLEYQYARDADNTIQDGERAGFRLTDGVLEFRNGAGDWQPITDPRIVTITALTISEVSPARIVELFSYCSCLTKLTCNAAQFQDSTLSPNYVSSRPRMTVRQFDVVLAGQSTADASVQREVRETVRVRNDRFTGNCPAV
jgi:type IV pilus assembly protein PilW